MLIHNSSFRFGGILLCMASIALVEAAPFDRARIHGSAVTIERDFVMTGAGQLHFRRAAPSDPAASVAIPVLCLHQTPNSSQVFIEFMTELAKDRVVFAVDTPGLGQSDKPLSQPALRDYAQAMLDFLDAKDLAEVDIVGYHTGASIAAELGANSPTRVRRSMLVGLALFSEAQRQQFFEQPWPKTRAADGGHLLEEWQRSHQWRGKGQSDSSVERTFIEKISAGSEAWWVAAAVMGHDLEAALSKMPLAPLVVNSKDDLFEITPRVKTIRPDVDVVSLPDYGFGLFEVIPEFMAELARDHFDQNH